MKQSISKHSLNIRIKPFCIYFTTVLIVGCLCTFSAEAQEMFFIKESKIFFESDAPLEIIKAVSTDMRGVIDPTLHTFGFSIASLSFKGFNSELQRRHFNENYLESEKYPEITFTGKIIDEIDFTKPGIYSVRAKGMLTIKGISHERIIRSVVEVKTNSFELKSKFDILLDDHNIRIPRIVYQKIAPTIQIVMNAVLQLQKIQ